MTNQIGQLAPDGQNYWNGNAWLSTLAPDKRTRWNGTSWSPVPPVKRGHKLRNAGIVVGGLIVLMIGVSMAAGTPKTSTPAAADKPAAAAAAPAVAAAKPAAAPAKAAPAAPAGPTLTNQQKNAAASAKQYLALMGFSRQGLIEQLSSSAGSGYSVQDATVAVDSLKVDWNAEAVQSAKDYLKTMPFSCTGLIQQLDSSAGSQYTVAEATYGAQQAGAC